MTVDVASADHSLLTTKFINAMENNPGRVHLEIDEISSQKQQTDPSSPKVKE